MLLTHITAVDPYFRLLNNIRSRRKAIQWQAFAQRGHSPQSEKALSELRRHEHILLNVGPNGLHTHDYRYVNQWFKSLGNVEEHCLSLFDIFLRPNPSTQKDELETRFLRNLKLQNSKIRVHELKNRILLETIHRISLGWYPIFNTLTVTNDFYEEVFSPGSRNFQRYIDRFKYAIRRATHDQDKTCLHGGHSYFAVVEEGDERGRLHFHVLHFCQSLPRNTHDPNSGRAIPNYRIISSCRHFWTSGFSSPIAARLNGMDNWARLGWRWPVERKGNRWIAIEASNPLRLANYIAKYITKGIEKDTFQWRTRTSQNFGAHLIKKSLTNLTVAELNHILTMTPQMMKLGDLQLPPNLVKKLTTKELLARLRNAPPNSKRSTKLKSLTHIKPQPSIVERFRTLTQTKPNHNSQNIGSKLTTNSNASDIFKIRQSFLDTLDEFEYSDIEIPRRGFNPRF
ncbi:putative replication initiation protein [Eel River basin pequenovirus]|nr:putative replication initiation protein [Eel River basin pequenovirus]